MGLSSLAPLCARAHEFDYQALQLIWDPQSSVLRGQVITDPRRVAGEGAARASRLLALLRDNLRLEVDGRPCPLRFEPRELWVRAGATAGDVVMAYCSVAHAPSSLRVFAGTWLHGLQVTVQRVAADAAVLTDRTMVLGGSWSPRFDFGAARGAWSAPPVDARPRQPPALSGWALARNYLWHGVSHILDGGWDHVAFVAALVLGAGLSGVGAWIARLTAFTVAHSITLALGALGWVVLPRACVESLIALSIALMALLNLRTRRPVRARYALGLAFVFGLLHGQGFASVLIDAGLPVAGLVLALLAFNLGVELGQGVWASGFWLALRALPAARARQLIALCSWLLVGLGLYWTWERVLFALG